MQHNTYNRFQLATVGASTFLGDFTPQVDYTHVCDACLEWPEITSIEQECTIQSSTGITWRWGGGGAFFIPKIFLLLFFFFYRVEEGQIKTWARMGVYVY
jgi:hypothetical protein